MEITDNNTKDSDLVGDSTHRWKKSSWSMTNGNCVEVVGLSGNLVRIRDSKNPRGPILGFTSAEWDAFVGGVRNGEFDRRR
jgi:hypothetical protein